MIQRIDEFIKELAEYCRNYKEEDFKEGEPDIDGDEQDLEEWRQEQARKMGEDDQREELLNN